ncbi:MAG: zinc ribbon domain-containing protein [Pirellulaceae bacterium]
MPIYEFGCPKCRVVFNFLYRKANPDKSPKCPRCGSRKMKQHMSQFAVARGSSSKSSNDGPEVDGPPMPDLDDPRVERVMNELERDMSQLDENNPRHLAHVMKKMKDIMPPGEMPREFDIAIRRLEAGEDIEKIEEDMGDVFGDLGGGPEAGGGSGGYTRDEGLYDYE